MKEAIMFTMIFCWKHFLLLLSGLILIRKTAALQVSVQVILKYFKNYGLDQGVTTAPNISFHYLLWVVINNHLC